NPSSSATAIIPPSGVSIRSANKHARVFALVGESPKNARKGFAKTAGRSEAAAVFRFIHATATAHFAQCETQSARTMVGLKRHSIVSLELASRGRGIDRHRRKLFIRQPSTRAALNFNSQTLDQLG